jgi:hypothetical protein
MESDKFCPFMLVAVEISRARRGTENESDEPGKIARCLGSACAWWQEDKCAVLDASNVLDILLERI